MGKQRFAISFYKIMGKPRQSNTVSETISEVRESIQLAAEIEWGESWRILKVKTALRLWPENGKHSRGLNKKVKQTLGRPGWSAKPVRKDLQKWMLKKHYGLWHQDSLVVWRKNNQGLTNNWAMWANKDDCSFQPQKLEICCYHWETRGKMFSGKMKSR